MSKDYVRDTVKEGIEEVKLKEPSLDKAEPCSRKPKACRHKLL